MTLRPEASNGMGSSRRRSSKCGSKNIPPIAPLILVGRVPLRKEKDLKKGDNEMEVKRCRFF